MIRVLKKLRRGALGYIENTSEKLVSPQVVPTGTIGNSTTGETIPYYSIGSGKQKVLIVGGIHGNEIGTVKLANKLTDWFSRNKIPQEITLFIIPCLNPDGLQDAIQNPDYGNFGRIGKVQSQKCRP